MERIKIRPQSLVTLMAYISLSANETTGACVLPSRPRPACRLTGRIHISDSRHPANSLLRKAAGPYKRVNYGSRQPGLGCSQWGAIADMNYATCDSYLHPVFLFPNS